MSFRSLRQQLDTNRLANSHPFKLIAAADSLLICIGTVNNKIPFIGGKKLSFNPSENIVKSNVSSDGFIYIKVTINKDGDITNSKIEFGEEIPDNNTSTCYMHIGSVFVNDSELSVFQSLTKSVIYIACPIPFSSPPEYTHSWGVL